MTTSLRTWLDSLDGPLVAAGIVSAFVALCLLCALYDAIHRSRARVRGPRRPSLSENHNRLDTEAARATTRQSTSSRKASRVPAGGTR